MSTPVQTPAEQVWNARADGRVRGFHEGLRHGYVQGVRWGVLCGTLIGGALALLGALVIGVLPRP